jgi:hypothetical protein
MPATLTFNQGYNEIARLAVERSLHWVSQLSKKLGNELVPDDKIARGITKRFLFLELINIGIELSRSAFVEVNKIHFLACGCTCRRFWSLDNAAAESAEKLFSEFDKYQKTVAGSKSDKSAWQAGIQRQFSSETRDSSLLLFGNPAEQQSCSAGHSCICWSNRCLAENVYVS